MKMQKVEFLALARVEFFVDMWKLVPTKGYLFEWCGIEFVLHRPLAYGGGHQKYGFQMSEPLSGAGEAIYDAKNFEQARRFAIARLDARGPDVVLDAIEKKIAIRKKVV